MMLTDEILKEIILLVRGYLCSTEFAPDPFTCEFSPDKAVEWVKKQMPQLQAEHTPPDVREALAVWLIENVKYANEDGLTDILIDGVVDDFMKQHIQPLIDKKDAEINVLKRDGIGESWYWQGDGYDHIESSTCPILIEANDFRHLIEATKKEERERIIREIEPYGRLPVDALGIIPFDIPQRKWQALKGGE